MTFPVSQRPFAARALPRAVPRPAEERPFFTRAMLIAAGVITPRDTLSRGDPSPEPSEPRAVPCLAIDHVGRKAAQRHRNEPRHERDPERT